MGNKQIELSGIAYVSTAKVPFSNDELETLSERAASNNAQQGITGYLYFSKGSFFQYIEGATAEVEALMQAIEEDPRHRVDSKVQETLKRDRRFPGWSMKSLNGVPHQNIEFEDVVQSQFKYLKLDQGGDDGWQRLLWESIGRLARLRERL